MADVQKAIAPSFDEYAARWRRHCEREANDPAYAQARDKLVAEQRAKREDDILRAADAIRARRAKAQGRSARDQGIGDFGPAYWPVVV